MNILILSPYPPYPPHGGGTMRIYQLIRGLAAQHEVTCLTFAPDAAAERELAPLRAVCRVLVVQGPPARSTLRRAWTALVSPLPDMALRNASLAYAAALHTLLAAESFDVIQAESIEMAGYLLDVEKLFETGSVRGNAPHVSLPPAVARRLRRRATAGKKISWRGLAPPNLPSLKGIGAKSKLVLDQFNAEYVLQKRAFLADVRRPRRWHAAGYSLLQWLKLARYERRVMAGCDAVLAVSEEDRRTLHALDAAGSITVVSNGVDTGWFSRAALARDGAGPLSLREHTLVFSGTLDFRPNVDAVVWFAREVLPRIRARCPDVRLVVVGKRPAPALCALASDGATTIVGQVPDARPYIAGAAVYIVPMRIGGGVRLKLLEALSLEAPVVSTSMGAEGVAGLRSEEHCLLADDAEQFAAAVLRLLADRPLGARLGAAGRALVQAHYDWSVIVPRLAATYEALVPA